MERVEWRERDDHSIEGWRGDLYLGVAIVGMAGRWIVQPCGAHAFVAASLDEAKAALSKVRR